MAPSSRRYSSDSSPSESSSEDERQRRRSGEDRHSEKKKAYRSSDESSDSERDRVKARGSKDDGGRRRRHGSDDEEAERKVAPRVSSRDERRGRDNRDERNRKKCYSSDESGERGRIRRRRHDSDDEEAERRRRLDGRGDRERARQESDDKKERTERSRKDGEDRGAERVRRNVDEEPERKTERMERSRKAEEDRRERVRRNTDEEIEEQKDKRERSRKDERDQRERARRNADNDQREISRKDVHGDDDKNKRVRDERKLDRERSRRDGDDDNKQDRDERKLDREHSRRDDDDDSMEEGELVDKKDERLKKREMEERAESPRRRDRYQEVRRRSDGDVKKSRDKGQSSSDNDEKRDDRARKRDRESSPRQKDRKREERRLRDGEERNGDDYDRRHRDQEKRIEKEAKEESKKEETAPIQQMPDAGVIKTGGIYIPPHRMAQMMREVQDKSSEQYQRLSWDALKKSINGLVNKVNAANIKNIIPELFSENLIRGRGLFCRSCMKSQMTSPGFTDVFAALVAVVNTKFPEVGKLLLKRIVLQLRRAYKRNDKPQLLAATKFIAHLVNQQVAHEIIALELLTLLLETPTDDSVEVAVGFVKECGALLQDFSPRGLHGIFERFRGILHEGEIDKRVQFLIEGLFAIRKAKFQGFPAIRPELDLVEQEDQFTHEASLEDEIDPETSLDVFKANPLFMEDEKAYEDVKISIIGDESTDDEEGSDAVSEDDDEEESEEDDEESMKIKDETETNLVNLRRTIYLTIMSSVDFEEAGHKLLKIKLEPGQEMELCIMLLECCSQERTYLRYYGLLGQRFCMINKVHQENFEKCFVQQYSMIHRLETNKLRNVAKFFAHLLGTNALPWHVLAYIRLTEEDTTSSSRIFIKILFQELSEHLGIRLLNERLNDPMMQDSFESIFPKDNPKNTRFAINFFTSVGLGGITESLREYLKNMPRLIMQQQKPVSESDVDIGSSSASSSGSSSSESDSSSESESDLSSDQREKRERHSKRRRRN